MGKDPGRTDRQTRTGAQKREAAPDLQQNYLVDRAVERHFAAAEVQRIFRQLPPDAIFQHEGQQPASGRCVQAENGFEYQDCPLAVKEKELAKCRMQWW